MPRGALRRRGIAAQRMVLVQDVSALWSARRLLHSLTARELRVRYAGTAVGVVWAYVQPLLLVAAYFLVFDLVFAVRLGAQAPVDRVGTYLVVGSVAWMAFGDAVGRGMNSLIDAGSLLQKNPLPPVLFVTRSVLASAVVYAPLMLALWLAYWPVHRAVAGLPALVALLMLQMALSWALAYTLAVLAAAVRDTVQMVGFALSVGIFASPVLFPMHLFPAAYQWLLYANPMTGLVLGYHDVLLRGQWPGWHTWVPTALWLVTVLCLLSHVLRNGRDELVDWL